MVLVGVRDEERPDVLLLVAEVRDVRDDEVDPEHLFVREHEPAVDDDDVVAVLEDVHVLADLPHPAERDDAERRVLGAAVEAGALRWLAGVGHESSSQKSVGGSDTSMAMGGAGTG